jgi:cell division protein FtsN
VYRVRVGPFERREEAENAKEKLGGSGVEATLVAVQR